MDRPAFVRTLFSDRWQAFVLLAALAAFCGSIWVFAEVADEVSEGEFQEIEEDFMRSLRDPSDPTRAIGPTWAEEVGRDLTALGGIAALSLVTLLVLGFLLLARHHRAAILLAVAMSGGLVLSLALKNMFDRPRPDVIPHLSHVMTSSFPSGHSMLSSIAYLTLGSLLARTVAKRRLQLYFVAAALLVSFLVGASRVYMGVHYPSDVLAGWAAGTAWAAGVWLVALWLQRRGVVEPPEGEPEAAESQDHDTLQA
jgi:undecaprenyl-diphosphatase